MATVTCVCNDSMSVTCDRAKGERRAMCGMCGPRRLREAEARLVVVEALLARLVAGHVDMCRAGDQHD